MTANQRNMLRYELALSRAVAMHHEWQRRVGLVWTWTAANGWDWDIR